MQGPECKSLYENLPDHIKASGEQMPIPASSMIRSHSVSGDLHGVQPDPIAADILRKEPEQEIFARLKISPHGTGCLSSLFNVHYLLELLKIYSIDCFCVIYFVGKTTLTPSIYHLICNAPNVQFLQFTLPIYH